MPKDLETVRLSFEEDTGIGRVTMDRPEALNTLNRQLRRDIVDGLERLGRLDTESDGVALRVVVLAGAGDRAFCAGADLTETDWNETPTTASLSHHRVLREFPVPIVAEVDGYCLGGGFEMALSADFRVASDRSTFGFPEVGLGFIPGAGGGQLLSAIAGPAVAKELVMTGKHVSAERAEAEGLVHRVVPADDLEEAVRSLAGRVADQAPLAVRSIKTSINRSTDVPLEDGIEFDGQTSALLRETADFSEGTAAFQEDRDPEFQGR